MTRETVLTDTFVELADSLVDDFDIVDLLTVLAHRCVELLDADAAGIVIVDADGALRATASSSETMRILELFELQHTEGPCWDCYRSGQPVVNQDLATSGARWPNFAPVAVASGFRSADAVPMRLRDQIIGALNLFSTEPGSLNDTDLVVARALADIATIAILQQRRIFDADIVNDQLNHALTSRIVIEQAKGVVAEREELDMPEAFERLRTYARNNNLRLHDIAAAIVDGTLDITRRNTSHE